MQNRWPIGDKEEIVARLRAIMNKETVTATNAAGQEIVSEAAADRNAAAAAKVLLAMEAQNQSDEHKAMPNLNMNLNANVSQALPKPQDADPEYIEYLRQRAIQEHSHAGTVCPNGQPRALEDVQTPRND